jgi:hypothetical protein
MNANTTTTYASKSTAIRGAQRKLGAKAAEGKAFKVKSTDDGRFYWQLVAKADKAKPAAKAKGVKANAAPVTTLATMREQTAGYLSSIESPCVVVFDLADKMKGARRRDVIAAAVEAGVNYYTARTQYQIWYTASKGGK